MSNENENLVRAIGDLCNEIRKALGGENNLEVADLSQCVTDTLTFALLNVGTAYGATCEAAQHCHVDIMSAGVLSGLADTCYQSTRMLLAASLLNEAVERMSSTPNHLGLIRNIIFDAAKLVHQ